MLNNLTNLWISFTHVVNGFKRERPGCGVVDVEFDVGFVVGDSDDILFCEARSILICKVLSVIGANLEGHKRSNVTKNGIANRGVLSFF